MRRDIKVSQLTGDVIIEDNDNDPVWLFDLVDELEDNSWLYAEITVDHVFNLRSLWSTGIRTSIPYIPIYKPFKIRIKKDYGGGYAQYLNNPANNTPWFVVKCGKSDADLRICQAVTLNSNYDYRIMFNESTGTASIYSAKISDLKIIDANKQNADLLLKCVPSNSYRYPTTGVGLTLYLNSNISNTDLANVIKREFDKDGVIVKNASFDSETGKLNLDIDTSNADANI